jgi:hypothetical protein
MSKCYLNVRLKLNEGLTTRGRSVLVPLDFVELRCPLHSRVTPSSDDWLDGFRFVLLLHLARSSVRGL